MKRFGLTLLAALVLVTCSGRESKSQSKQVTSAPPTSTGTASGHIPPQGPVISYADTVDRVAPAVVTVHSARRIHGPQQFEFQNNPFFNWFFGQGGSQQRPGGNGSMMEERALGSGVIVRNDGYILTNDHVVDGAEDISVDLPDRRTFKAKMVGADKPSDLAVLKIGAGNLPVLSLGNSDQVRVGDVCLAVGNPLGIGETVTEGIISAKGRQTDLSNGNFEDFLQTDASINQGNSGGALVNTRAELIGINSQIISSGGGGNIGIGFAIPSNMAKTVMTQLISTGKVSRGQLGVSVQTLTADLAASLGLKQTQGVLVSGVEAGGPADKAGIKTGDVIIDIDGAPVNDPNVLRNRVAAAGGGRQIVLNIVRNGSQQKVQVRLGEFKAAPETATNQSGGGGSQQQSAPSGRLGVEVTPITSGLASQLGVPRGTQGVVITAVSPNSPAAQAGLKQGDIIQQVNRQDVRSGRDVDSALGKSGNRPALLQIMRGGQSIFVAVPLS